MRGAKAVAVVGLILFVGIPAGAQAPAWRFSWKAGQILNYKVEHVTSVAEVIGGAKEQTTSKLNLSKQWKVLSVDAAGVATLQLTLVSMRNEQTRPSGETLLFDSANPDKSTPALKDSLAKFIGTVIAEIRIDANGKVIESKKDPLDRFDAEPPFQVVLPGAVVAQGQSWERPFTIVLNPPQGTGERYAAVQHYQCKEMNAYYARIAVKTAIKNLPPSPLDQVPLFQKLADGEVIFNHSSGMLHGARLRIVRDLTEHQGKNSSYHFESDYKEDFVPATSPK